VTAIAVAAGVVWRLRSGSGWAYRVMSDKVLANLVSLAIIFAGVVWIVAGTIWTASDLCIAIGMVTIAVGWISFMVEFRNRTH